MKKTKKIKSFLAKNGKIAKSVLVIAIVLAAAGVTFALFSDRAESQGNTLSSGSVDLKIKVPETDCVGWSDTCPGKQWSGVYPGWHDSYEVFLKNVSVYPYDLKVTPLVEETGSSQALYNNTYLEITWENGAKTTGRYSLQAWKNNTTLELERMAQDAEAGPYLIRLDIPSEVGNEIAESSIEFNLVFGAEQIEVRTLTLALNPEGAGTVTGEGQYADDSLAAITATASLLWEFTRWEGTGITDPNSASTTVLVDGNKTITAVFSGSTLIADWNFNESSGTTLTDASGYNNHGTISGATRVAGKEGNALEFDGSNDYVSIPYNSNFDLGTYSAFTIEYWVYRHTTNWHTTFSQMSTSYSNDDPYNPAVFASRFWSGGNEHMWTIARAVADEYGFAQIMQRSNYLTLNNWHHVANVYDGATMKTYVNGVQTGSTENVSGIALAPAANYPSLIGVRQEGSWQSQYFDGLLDHMRIWKKALSLSEIQDHYLNP